MHPCSSGRTAATAGLRSRFVRSTAALCPSYTGRTPWSTPSPRLRRVRAEIACGTGFTWKGRTVGGLLRTGSAGHIPPRAGHARSRETTNTFPPWRASESSSPPTSSGRSTIPGSCTPERGAGIRRSPIFNWHCGSVTALPAAWRISCGKRSLPTTRTPRAQFEAFAATGWANHKMTMYWMLNSHWPSFYGNIIDYYLSPGGAYYGAKRGLRPLSVVFDSYAAGDRTQARIAVFNQTPGDVRGLRVRTRVYDLDGKVRDDRSAGGIAVPFNGATQAMVLPRFPQSSPVFFVRCQLFDGQGRLVVDNTYWQSQKDDDLGARTNDSAMALRQDSWADMTALNTMPPVVVKISARRTEIDGENRVTIRLHNPSGHIAFFERATLSAALDGNEILPIEYDDNYITIFPGEAA